MKKIQITNGQFFVIVFSSIYANDLIRGFYSYNLKHNVLYAVILGIIGSIGIFYSYSFIYKSNNYANFTESIENIIGKFFSKIFFIIYILYFLFIAFLNLRDISEIIQILLLPEFAIYVLGGSILFLLYYIISHGIEVFARIVSIIFFISFVLFIFFSVFLFTTNEVHFEFLMPVLEHGVKPIIEPAYQMSYSIPFGELFVLLIIFQYVKEKKKGYKYGIYALIFGGYSLLLITLYNIVIIGPEAMIVSIYPSMTISKRLEIKSLFQRFDLIDVNIMLSLMLVKLSVLLFASQHLISKIIKIKRENLITIFICLILLFSLIIFGHDYMKLIQFRRTIVIPYINLIFEIFIPFTLIVISLFRNVKVSVQKFT